MRDTEINLFLTGASGLLGRAIFTRFSAKGWNIYGTAISRVRSGLHKLDLTDPGAVERAIKEFKPHIVIHCAAQRFPDKVASNPTAAEELNVYSTKHIAVVAAQLAVPVLYISTDYVFDGKSPPYSVEDQPNPVNLYGKTKLRGEEAILLASTGNIILRVPVLYGPVERLSESAVTVLLECLMDTSQSCTVSDYEKRCPSHVDDIAEICFNLALKKLEGADVAGVYHWCGHEVLTKYAMILHMAELFQLPHAHVSPASDPPLTDTTPRPFNTRLDTSRLESLGIKSHTPFKDGIYSVLKSWVVVKNDKNVL